MNIINGQRLYGASFCVVLQLFIVEATRLGLAGSTDLQTPVPVPEGSFLCLRYFQQLEKLSKVRLNQRYQRTDNIDNTLWVTIVLRMTLYYVEYYWQCVVAKALPLPVGSETNTSLPCIDNVVSPPSVLLLNSCNLALRLLSGLPLPFKRRP